MTGLLVADVRRCRPAGPSTCTQKTTRYTIRKWCGWPLCEQILLGPGDSIRPYDLTAAAFSPFDTRYQLTGQVPPTDGGQAQQVSQWQHPLEPVFFKLAAELSELALRCQGWNISSDRDTYAALQKKNRAEFREAVLAHRVQLGECRAGSS